MDCRSRPDHRTSSKSTDRAIPRPFRFMSMQTSTITAGTLHLRLCPRDWPRRPLAATPPFGDMLSQLLERSTSPGQDASEHVRRILSTTLVSPQILASHGAIARRRSWKVAVRGFARTADKIPSNSVEASSRPRRRRRIHPILIGIVSSTPFNLALIKELGGFGVNRRDGKVAERQSQR